MLLQTAKWMARLTKTLFNSQCSIVAWQEAQKMLILTCLTIVLPRLSSPRHDCLGNVSISRECKDDTSYLSKKRKQLHRLLMAKIIQNSMYMTVTGKNNCYQKKSDFELSKLVPLSRSFPFHYFSIH